MAVPLSIHFHAATTPDAQQALQELTALHGQTPAKDADLIVPLGGDGTMLEALHLYEGLKKPFYGMNLGSVGFLLNPYTKDKLQERLKAAQPHTLHPLRMSAHNADGITEGLAFNEVSLIRKTRRAANIKIIIDGNDPVFFIFT